MKLSIQPSRKLKLLLLLAFGFLFSYGVATAQTIIWSEEFDSGTAPDPAVWSYDLGAGGWGNSEIQEYTSDPANVRIEGGNLIITAVETIVRNKSTYTSARINTLDKFTFTYGTIEARIMTPDLADGLWPAFWTLGNNIDVVGWPDCGELDILEMGFADAILEGVVNRRVGSTAHWEVDGNYAGYGLTYDAPSDLNGAFHTYIMDWTPTMISTYIDNQLIWAFDISDPASFDGEEFHQPHAFNLNLAVGGILTDIYSSRLITASFPAEYVVDYIRIYDNGDTVLGGTSIGGGENQAPTWNADPVVEVDATEATSYTATLADDASDADNDPLTFSKVSGPSWLSIASDGTLSGIPASIDVGVNTFDVNVSDGINSAIAAVLEITVLSSGGTSGGTLAHVDSIVLGTSGGGPRTVATATVVIVDENGAAVAGADVTGTFSGSHNETIAGTTDSTGLTTLITTVANKTVAFDFCVDDVISTLTYDSAANVVTSVSY